VKTTDRHDVGTPADAILVLVEELPR